MYDTIVVGARCAGAATALLLARAGKRVLLLDRAAFPSDTVSGHFIMHPGTRKLADWGLLESVIDSGAPPITRFASHSGDFLLECEVSADDGLPACIGPRRFALDNLLVNAAVAAGAEFRPSTALTGLLWEAGRVAGVKLRTAGREQTERATVVVGADGKNSLVARLTGAATYREVPAQTCWYISYWGDLPVAGLEAHWSGGRLALVFPTNGGVTAVAVGWRHARFKEVRADVDRAYRLAISGMPVLAPRFADAHRAEPYTGMADLPNFFRQPWGPGWALVGDAGHFKDPTNAKGISDAFQDADLLAKAIGSMLDGGMPEAAAMAAFHEERDGRAIPDSEFNLMRADLDSWGAPPMLALRAALGGDVENTRRLYRAISGIDPWQQFFNPAHLESLVRGTAATAS